MKRNMLSIVAVLAFALLVAGVAYAHVDQNRWCNGNSGSKEMMDSQRGNMMGANGHMMGSYAEHMGPANENNGGHMSGPSSGHMMARSEGKNQAFECPGWDAGSRDAGNMEGENE